ncbi:family 43 glycosylhydrolase [Streptomyces ferrugineus]|uniref:Family 43 glycosylhydrolase n=1 Tax=Streptomyces ferrugineus TaxID=1413221 RepID=A0A7M2SAU7_9ACTN|nr:glycoside hydrolase family 43 protein [Streptomyces ferrugineus]QOV33149.1 family 43 glycosylhydrolase [Streptomyces ferrugineus]
MTNWPNPLIPGFNPDPSVVLVDGVYYLVTSTFEYLPGLPVYRSTDLVDWEHIGNVAERPEQVAVGSVVTGAGVFAPTIRHHDGLFHVIVTVVGSPRGCVVFTAADPAGPWSDGLTVSGVDGIDPDLAWDDDGTAYITYSGLRLSGEEAGRHYGIEQVRVDLTTGLALENPRSLWSGTGLRFPEAPHLYRRGEHWYLVIAEGGTERGHAVSVARGVSPAGPFTGHPGNPLLTASGTPRPVQNTGHADLVETPDGGWAMVLLGVRTLGEAQAFSPLGRETFITDVTWTEDGWPAVAPVEPAPRAGTENLVFSFEDETALDDPGWLAVRTTPRTVARVTGGHLALHGRKTGLDDPQPVFVGRRQRHLNAVVTTTVDVTDGVGGLATRYDERHHFGLEARTQDGSTVVTAWGAVAGLRQEWRDTFPSGPIELALELGTELGAARVGDRIRLLAGGTLLAELDGRYWTAETCASFTGRIIGLYASEGAVRFADYRYAGRETVPDAE